MTVFNMGFDLDVFDLGFDPDGFDLDVFDLGFDPDGFDLDVSIWMSSIEFFTIDPFNQ